MSGVRKKFFTYFLNNGPRFYPQQELNDIAQSNSWARTLRQLKQDDIVDFDYDPAKKGYHIRKIAQVLTKSKRVGISAKLSYKIRNRDFHTCQSCGKTAKDGVKLHIDHKIPVEWGGTNDEDNLWTLCDYCNQGKKSFFKDEFDPEIMKLIYKEKSAEARLKVLFEKCLNKPLNSTILQSIAGIQDWPRSIRLVRQKTGMNIQFIPKNKNNPEAYYINLGD